MRPFDANRLGFLPHEAWGGGSEGDGTDLFGDTPRGVNARGDCVDPMVHRQTPDADRAAEFLAKERPQRHRKVTPRLRLEVVAEIACAIATILCPSAEYEIVKTPLAPTVIRRRAVAIADDMRNAAQ